MMGSALLAVAIVTSPAPARSAALAAMAAAPVLPIETRQDQHMAEVALVRGARARLLSQDRSSRTSG